MNRRRVLAALLAAAAPARAAALDMQIWVKRRGDLLLIDAVLVVPVAQRVAWSVLTDFDAMADYVPNLISSRVMERDGGRLRVEQHGVVRWGLLAQHFTTLRDIELDPIAQVRSQSLGGSLQRLSSLTRFAAVADGTEIRHHVEFEVATWMPAPLIEPFLRHEVREQFEAVVEEMVRRGAKGR
jgi:ribosome-associated toxin RatA of RatAB toxin-antitoxin module